MENKCKSTLLVIIKVHKGKKIIWKFDIESCTMSSMSINHEWRGKKFFSFCELIFCIPSDMLITCSLTNDPNSSAHSIQVTIFLCKLNFLRRNAWGGVEIIKYVSITSQSELELHAVTQVCYRESCLGISWNK